MAAFVTILLSSSFFSFSSACSESSAFFGAGRIVDIYLDDKESMDLKLKINNGVYDYCRLLNLQTGELAFDEVSCEQNIREWTTPPTSYDITVSHADSDSFDALDESAKAQYIENVNSTQLYVTIDGYLVDMTLDDVFVHPLYYSSFYSPSMKTLFIMTAARDASDDNDAYVYTASDLDLVSISWNPFGSEFEYFAADLNDFVYASQDNVDVNGNGNDTEEIDFLMYHGAQWTTYDDDEMYMVQVDTNMVVSIDCVDEQPTWLQYEYIADVYEQHKAGNDTAFSFEYAGVGYTGFDTRVKRAYAFDDTSVWYFSLDFEDNHYSFSVGELASYWAVMWFAIALVLLCCCCCCVYRCKKRQNQKEMDDGRFGGMTAEQEMMTQV